MSRADGPKPLSGVRILELGIAIAAPFCTRQLATFGAEVLKVESPNNPDVVRILGAAWARGDDALTPIQTDLSAYISEMTSGKRSVALDLKKAGGADACRKLVAQCDVVVTNYSASAVRTLGFDYESVRALRPDIIYVGLPGFGSDPTKPYYEHVAWGPNQAPLVGLDSLTGYPDQDPAGIGPIAPPDYWSSMIAAMAVLSGLRHRDRTGEGAFVDISQFEGSVGLLSPFLLNYAITGRDQPRTGNRAVNSAPNGVYPSRGTDNWVAISVLDDAMWASLGRVAGSPGWAQDPRFVTAAGRQQHHDEIDAAIGGWTSTHTHDELASWLQEAGVAAYTVLELEDVAVDPQVRDRRWFQVLPSTRLKRDITSGTALKLRRTPGSLAKAGTAMGEATREVLRDVAGFDDEAVDDLFGAKAAYDKAECTRELARPYDPYLSVLMPHARDTQRGDGEIGRGGSIQIAAASGATATPDRKSRGVRATPAGPGSGPLSGIRVVDFGGLNTAYGTMVMAAMGADVVCIEPAGGDELRAMAPYVGPADPEHALWWTAFGQGKRSVALDLASEPGRRSVADLMVSADVVFDAQPIDQLTRLGIGHEAMLAAASSLVWVSITPFGLTGPRRNWKGSNLVAWAASGVLNVTGFPDGAPVTPGGPVNLACHFTSMSGLNAALFALRARDLDGQGQLIDLSMQEVALSIAPETGVPLFLDDMFHRTRSGNRRILARPWGHYRCLDGFVSTLVLQPTHWINVAQWISEETGNDMFTEEAFRDLTVRAEINDLIDEWFEMVTVTKTKLEVFAEGQRRGVPVTPLNTIADLLSDPHLEATGFFDFAEHPVLGTYKRPGAPFRVNHSWWSLGRAPLLGEHTAEVLAEWG